MEFDKGQVLEKFGLTAAESKLYLALLDLGPCLAGKLSRKTGIHRRNVYDATERLIAKGLISYILKNNRRTFTAVHPGRFMEMVKDNEFALSHILPEMTAKYDSVIPKEGVDFYKGKLGLKTMFEGQIREGKEILVYGGSLLAYDFMKYYFVWYDKKRIAKKMDVKMIIPKSAKKSIGKLERATLKVLPDEFIGDAAYNVYGDTVAIILWSKDNPLTIVIKDRKIADSFRKNFSLAWGMAQ